MEQESTMPHLPDFCEKQAYGPNKRDRNPEVKPAGKLTLYKGDGVKECMTFAPEKPVPAIIQRFRRAYNPDLMQNRIHYGVSEDPHLIVARAKRHGAVSHESESMADRINPTPITLFHEKLAITKEQDYASHKRAPLGRLPIRKGVLPDNLDVANTTFGRPAIADEGVNYTVNPNKTYAQVMEESQVGHRNYIISHKDYNPHEKVNRNYDVPYDPNFRYGELSNADYNGKRTAQSLRYPTEDDKQKGARIHSKRLDDYNEKYHPKLGQVLEPMKNTRHVGPDHAYGRPPPSNGYSLPELLHDRLPRSYVESRDMQRGLIAAMRHHLKMEHFVSYPEIYQILRYYDKEGTGKVDIDDVRETCEMFGLPVDPWLLEQVLDYCDEERNRLIDYSTFCNFLDWQDFELPEAFSYVPYNVEQILGDRCMLRHSDSTFSRPEIARWFSFKPDPHSTKIQKAVDNHVHKLRTTSEMINATVGNNGFNTTGMKTLGVPTIRTDLTAPDVKILGDTRNFGDQSDAAGLINPSVYDSRGVYEKHLLQPRSITELWEIFFNAGMFLPQDTMETIYNHVAENHPEGHVSLESFRNTMDDMLKEEILACKQDLAF